MEVKKNAPPPQPPPTFDILGLTLDEATFLRDLLGRIVASSTGVPGLYHKLCNSMDSLASSGSPRWRFSASRAGGGYDYPVGTINAEKLL